MSDMYFFEPEREIPVVDNVDVLVAGAGVAGICAAVASARQGIRTALIESCSYMGGTASTGLPWASFSDGKNQIVFGIANEMATRIYKYGGITTDMKTAAWNQVDPEIFKMVAMEMLEEANIRLLLHTLVVEICVDGGKIVGIIIENKGGRQVIRCNIAVDCTGDADIAYRAGVPMKIGRSSDSHTQPMTMVFAVGGIDMERFKNNGEYPGMVELFAKIADQESFENPRRDNLSGMHMIPGRKGECVFNVTRVLEYSGTNPADLTKAELAGRRQVREFFYKFLKPHVPGFEEAYLAETASHIGVRETRRIVGEYILTREDVQEYREQEDVIGRGSYPIDIHSPDGSGTEFLECEHIQGRSYALPYKMLVPKMIDNLLVAGRCVSSTHEALSAIRVIPACMVMGQAAGTAAALCIKNNMLPREMNIRLLQNALEEDGVLLRMPEKLFTEKDCDENLQKTR